MVWGGKRGRVAFEQQQHDRRTDRADTDGAAWADRLCAQWSVGVACAVIIIDHGRDREVARGCSRTAGRDGVGEIDRRGSQIRLSLAPV